MHVTVIHTRLESMALRWAMHPDAARTTQAVLFARSDPAPLSETGSSREPGCEGGFPLLPVATAPDSTATAAGALLPLRAEGEEVSRASLTCTAPDVEGSETVCSAVPRALICSNVMLSDASGPSAAPARQHQKPLSMPVQNACMTTQSSSFAWERSRSHAKQTKTTEERAVRDRLSRGITFGPFTAVRRRGAHLRQGTGEAW